MARCYFRLCQFSAFLITCYVLLFIYAFESYEVSYVLCVYIIEQSRKFSAYFLNYNLLTF